jgi:hypothetical protein
MALSVSRTKNLWLLSCHNYPLLAKALEICVKDSDLRCLKLLVFEEESGAKDLIEMVHLAFFEACFQAGLFEGEQIRPEIEIILASTAEIVKILLAIEAEENQLCLIPEALTLNSEQELDLEVSAQQSIFLEDFEDHWPLNEAFLLDLYQAPLLLKLQLRDSYVSTALHCAQQLLRLSPNKDPEQTPLMARLKSLIVMNLVPYGLDLKGRNEIQQAILRLHANSGDLPAAAVLRLFQRHYSCLSENLINQTIELCPPLSDLTVTILIVSYNRLDLLKRAVEAVLEQSSTRWELIILDHGSQDGTSQWLEGLVDQYPDQIKTLKKEFNQGPQAVGQLYQELLALVETELVLIQSDDDWLYPKHLERVLNFWQRHPWVAMVTTSYQLLSPEGEEVYQYGPFYPLDCVGDSRQELLRSSFMRICPQAAVIRKELLGKLATQDTLFYLPSSRFAVWDFAITALIAAQYEVGVLESVLSAFTVSERTAFYGQNFVWHQLTLFQKLIHIYNRLWGAASFPRSIALQTLQAQIELAVRHFQQALYQASESDTLPELLKQERLGWDLIVTLRQDLAKMTRSNFDHAVEISG